MRGRGGGGHSMLPARHSSPSKQHPLPFSLAAHPYSTCHVVKKKGCAALLSKKKNSLFPIRTSVLPPCHVVATLRGSIVNATVPCQTTILQHLQEHGFFSHNHPLYYMLFSHSKPATSNTTNQTPVLLSQNRPTPAISHRTDRFYCQAAKHTVIYLPALISDNMLLY